MGIPTLVTPTCYNWHQFTVAGEWIAGGGPFGRGEYRIRKDVYLWLVENIKGKWANIDGADRCPLFIEQGIDAMLFKLTWEGQ